MYICECFIEGTLDSWIFQCSTVCYSITIIITFVYSNTIIITIFMLTCIYKYYLENIFLS
jgi:hypothetical protein